MLVRTPFVTHVGMPFTPRTRRRLSGPLLFGVFQLAFWSLFALVFVLTVRPYHLFTDILLRQAAATAALGLAASAVLERLQALLQRLGAPSMAKAVGVLVSGVLLGLAWYALAAWAGDRIDPFEYLRMPCRAESCSRLRRCRCIRRHWCSGACCSSPPCSGRRARSRASVCCSRRRSRKRRGCACCATSSIRISCSTR